jgi:hypothetical protein
MPQGFFGRYVFLNFLMKRFLWIANSETGHNLVSLLLIRTNKSGRLILSGMWGQPNKKKNWEQCLGRFWSLHLLEISQKGIFSG